MDGCFASGETETPVNLTWFPRNTLGMTTSPRQRARKPPGALDSLVAARHLAVHMTDAFASLLWHVVARALFRDALEFRFAALYGTRGY